MDDGASNRGPSVGAGDIDSRSQTSTSEKHPAPSGPSDSTNAQNPQHSKRRRGLGVVTPNACTECRKKRAKCDGQRPCGRCKAQKDVECVYEVPVRQSKENLRAEIDQLRQRQSQSDNVLSALTRPEFSEEVLQRLRTGQGVEGISEWLGSALSAGSGGVPAFAQREDAKSGLGRGLPSLATYSGHGEGMQGFPQMNMSPATTQPRQSLKPDFESGNQWQFSAQSQSASTRSGSHPDIMQWQPDGPPQSLVGSWINDQTAQDERYRGFDQVLAPLDKYGMKVPAGAWTSVTSDSALVQHLLALYFCWEYPTFASLSKEHFLKDFMDGRHRYCSPILVNALLALGCRFSSQPSTREYPDNPHTSGDHFFKESLRLFAREEDHHSLPTIQALGIMSIREASCGRDSESWYYAGQSIRLAIELGLHRISDDGDHDELAVQAATFWGAFALDHAWSLATGSLPHSSCFPRLPPKPTIIDGIEASVWLPYTDDGAPFQRSCEQPSNVRSVYKCFCELSELVHQSLYILHSPNKPVTSRDLLKIYTQYLNWYDRIPEVLRLGHNFTPAVLFAHMYYHFAILLLFRPLIKLRITGSSIIPRDVCTQAADAIQGLLRSYSQLYTLRRTPSFVPYFVLTSSIMHLAVMAVSETSSDRAGQSGAATEQIKSERASSASVTETDATPTSTVSGMDKARLSPKVSDAISQGIADLAEMAPCHHFAEQALNILRYLAQKWEIDVHIPVTSNLTPQQAESITRPVTSSLNFFAPNFEQNDLVCGWDSSVHGMSQKTVVNDAEAEGQALSRSISSSGRHENDLSSEAVMAGGGVGAGGGGGGGGEGGKESSPKAQNSDPANPLFWPFPMQGRPILPHGPDLEKAGFELL